MLSCQQCNGPVYQKEDGQLERPCGHTNTGVTAHLTAHVVGTAKVAGEEQEQEQEQEA